MNARVDLKGKRAVVTGGTRGIGFAIVRALSDAGARVAFCGTSEKSLSEALKNLSGREVFASVADVSNSGSVRDFFRFVDEKLGGVDILVNNAGVGIFRKTAELSVEEWRRTVGINLDGAFFCSREALQRMLAYGNGYIINISSLAGKNAFAGGAAYNASKFGLNGFTEALMLDHRHDNVRVSYIMPGSVDTEFGSGTERAKWKIAPEDVAETVLNLLAMPDRTLISCVEMRPSRPPKAQ
ncbi:MAG TPA: SDR family oxidoreductase [Bryobacteraceae bacterium]|nr:SDR family oxidoreductase [Bryobacteraceae bacterium]